MIYRLYLNRYLKKIMVTPLPFTLLALVYLRFSANIKNTSNKKTIKNAHKKLKLLNVNARFYYSELLDIIYSPLACLLTPSPT